jgi:hypothetical protein
MSEEMKRGLHFHDSSQAETLQFPRTPSDNNATFLNESIACLTLSLCGAEVVISRVKSV